MYPHEGTGARIDVKVGILVVNKESCRGSQLRGNDKTRSTCSKELYKTFHGTSLIHFKFTITGLAACPVKNGIAPSIPPSGTETSPRAQEWANGLRRIHGLARGNLLRPVALGQTP